MRSALWSATQKTKPPSLLAPLLLTEDCSELYIWCLSAITMWFGGLELSFIYERHIALQERDNIFKWVRRARSPLCSRQGDQEYQMSLSIEWLYGAEEKCSWLVFPLSEGRLMWGLPGDTDQEESERERRGWRRAKARLERRGLWFEAGSKAVESSDWHDAKGPEFECMTGKRLQVLTEMVRGVGRAYDTEIEWHYR